MSKLFYSMRQGCKHVSYCVDPFTKQKHVELSQSLELIEAIKSSIKILKKKLLSESAYFPQYFERFSLITENFNQDVMDVLRDVRNDYFERTTLSSYVKKSDE